MATDLTKVMNCDMLECAYNIKEQCHAIAVSVGMLQRPICDNFVKSDKKMGISEINGIVGVCRIKNCQFNRVLECNAKNVLFKKNSVYVKCGTFHPL